MTPLDLMFWLMIILIISAAVVFILEAICDDAVFGIAIALFLIGSALLIFIIWLIMWFISWVINGSPSG